MVIILLNFDPPWRFENAGASGLDPLVTRVLGYLNVKPGRPSLALLDSLVTAYTRIVPWESASRIARRAATPNTTDCPRWPGEFWQSAIEHGTGGTCFESNYAFFHILQSLGFEGYLTVNNMGEKIGCHTALVILVEGRRYLVDVGLPLYVPIPLDEQAVTARESEFHTYTITPQAEGRYLVGRDRHPRPDCYTLVDVPVGDADYRAATTADYGVNGLFLDQVIFNRVVEGRIWRFAGEHPPYHLESFNNEDKTYHFIGEDPLRAAEAVARKFGADDTIIRAALNAILERSG